MPDKWPLANGSWSNAANWNSGTKPIAGDDVYLDGKTVTLDEDPVCRLITNATRSGGTAGGVLTWASGTRNISCNITAGAVSVASPWVVEVTGSGSIVYTGMLQTISGGTDGKQCIRFNSTGAITAVYTIGTHAGANGACSLIAIYGTAAGGVSLTGAMIGGTSGNAGLYLASSCTVNLYGNAIGGSTSFSYGVFGAFGMAPQVNVYGDVLASGASGVYFYTPAASLLIVTGSITASAAAPGVTVWNSTAGIVRHQGNLIDGPSGRPAIQGPIIFLDTAAAVTHTRRSPAGAARMMYSAATIPGVPSASNVRLGTVYGPSSELTGTLAVPPVGSVAVGVPVDNTVGTALLTEQSIANAVAPLLAAYGS